MSVMTSDKRRRFRETCSVFRNFSVFCSTNNFEINSVVFLIVVISTRNVTNDGLISRYNSITGLHFMISLSDGLLESIPS